MKKNKTYIALKTKLVKFYQCELKTFNRMLGIK